jgi:hypothetical protein
MSSRRKYRSGSEKRKRKKCTDDFIETQKEIVDKFFKNNPCAWTNPNNKLVVVVVMEEEVPVIGISEEEEEENVNLNVDENSTNISLALLSILSHFLS